MEEQPPLRLSPFTNFSFPLSHGQGGNKHTTGILPVLYTGNHSNAVVLLSLPANLPISGPVSCHVWQDAQHALFQLANLCAAVSLLTPTSFTHHLLFLRCLLLASYLMSCLWAGLLVCMLDVLLWNCVFLLLDTVHLVILVYRLVPNRFHPGLNELYTKKLRPLRVTRRELYQLSRRGRLIPVPTGSCYAVEDETPCGQKVSILLGGRLKVTNQSIFLHSVEPNEFLDSAEFDSVRFYSSDRKTNYQVTITAVEESLIICWTCSALTSYLASCPFMASVFWNLIGKDICDKLYRVQERMNRQPRGKQPVSLRPCSPLHDVSNCLLSSELEHLQNLETGFESSPHGQTSDPTVPTTLKSGETRV